MDTDGDLIHDSRPLVRRLGKLPEEWQRRDLVELCVSDGIRVVNFHYPSLDGKLRELRLPVTSRMALDRLLAAGERVDGSSLFPGVFRSAESDLYAVPVYRWAFLNPWAHDELDVVCRFADREGRPAAATPDNLLAGAAERLANRTGKELLALAELEFYLVLERDDDRFTGKTQRNYHQGAPYVHGRPVVDEILRTASEVIGHVKYCHSEVGYIDRIESEEVELDGRRVEQYELELDLMPIADLGCWLTVARWLIRVIADRYGASVTHAPKLDEGMAGSGMHLHLALEADGHNVTYDDGDLSDDALRLIGGLLAQAAPLTAFGNTVASSYLRLVPGQEAPTSVCWGRHNRASLVRVPLAFDTRQRMDQAMNPGETGPYPSHLARPTVEYRSPDGSALPHLLLAAVTVAAEAGLTSAESLEFARALEVKADPEPGSAGSFESLPATAVAAARLLAERRWFFEEGGFAPRLIDFAIHKLEAEADERLADRLRALPAAERLVESRRLMHKDLHKH